MYQAYYEDGLVSKERYEQLMIAATNKSKEAQYQSSKELYASQGLWQSMQMNLVDAAEQRTANMMTGMLMGTKSFSDSMKEFSSSLASSIISDLIRIAIQAQITNALTGLMGDLLVAVVQQVVQKRVRWELKPMQKGTFIVHLASANIAIRWLAHRHCLPLQKGAHLALD